VTRLTTLRSTTSPSSISANSSPAGISHERNSPPLLSHSLSSLRLSSRQLRALLSVCGGCSFGGLGCCSCRVRVSMSGVLFSVCVCDLLICVHAGSRETNSGASLDDLPLWHLCDLLPRRYLSRTKQPPPPLLLAFTRYCHHQYCMVYGIQQGGRWCGGVYCAMVVQQYCNRVGFATGGGNTRVIDSHNTALK